MRWVSNPAAVGYNGELCWLRLLQHGTVNPGQSYGWCGIKKMMVTFLKIAFRKIVNFKNFDLNRATI